MSAYFFLASQPNVRKAPDTERVSTSSSSKASSKVVFDVDKCRYVEYKNSLLVFDRKLFEFESAVCREPSHSFTQLCNLRLSAPEKLFSVENINKLRYWYAVEKNGSRTFSQTVIEPLRRTSHLWRRVLQQDTIWQDVYHDLKQESPLHNELLPPRNDLQTFVISLLDRVLGGVRVISVGLTDEERLLLNLDQIRELERCRHFYYSPDDLQFFEKCAKQFTSMFDVSSPLHTELMAQLVEFLCANTKIGFFYDITADTSLIEMLLVLLLDYLKMPISGEDEEAARPVVVREEKTKKHLLGRLRRRLLRAPNNRSD